MKNKRVLFNLLASALIIALGAFGIKML